MVRVTHYPPRKHTSITRKQHNRQLVWCFIASVAFMVILALVSWAWGQTGADHPFPFKTLEDITTGTPAWVLAGLPQLRVCPSVDVMLAKYQYMSGAGSGWVVYTDGKLFAAAYFPPGDEVPVGTPITIVGGSIKDGKQVIVESNTPFTGTQAPCDRWLQKSAMEG